tara:strand:- start:2232 stop:2570 length:339 start_codon:yes stop_codon:yes gene_type:complete
MKVNKNQCQITVEGLNMTSENCKSLQPGDCLFLSESLCCNSELFILGNVYVITHKAQRKIHQITMFNNETQEVTLHSFNKNFKDFKIHLNDVEDIRQVLSKSRSRNRIKKID